MVVAAALLGLVAGFLLAWALAGSRARAAEGAVAELRHQLAQKEEELRQSRTELSAEKAARVRAETLLAAAEERAQEQRQFLEEAARKLGDTFSALAGQALRHNNETFLALARQTLEGALAEAKGELGQRQQAFEALIGPLKEALARYDHEIREMEKARREAYGSLARHLEELGRAQQQLQSETKKLVAALRAPRVRGRWGELTLQRVVEMAGLAPYCDYVAQPTVEDEESRRRPDLVVRLPNGRVIVIDAKAPLEAYLEAVEAEDEETRREALLRHAQAVRSHMAALGTKEYQSQFRSSLDLVVLFLPGEPFFAAAVEHDPALLEDAFNRRVLLATPVTLVALLKAVAYGWQQREAGENAERVVEAGRQLFDRLTTFAEHLDAVRRGLLAAVKAYNEAVGAWQARLLPGARRLKELGAAPPQKEPREPGEVALLPREPGRAAAAED